MLRPLGNKLILTGVRKDEATASGLALVHSDVLQSCRGTLLAVGPDVKSSALRNCPHPIVVYFSKFAGQKTDEFIILTEDEVLAYEVQDAL